jgi:hypothetical protein
LCRRSRAISFAKASASTRDIGEKSDRI